MKICLVPLNKTIFLKKKKPLLIDIFFAEHMYIPIKEILLTIDHRKTMAPPLGSLLWLAPGHDGVPGLAANTEHWGAWDRPKLQHLLWRVGGFGERMRTPDLWESVGRGYCLAG